MLANLLIFLSASVAALALLDFLMDDDQKKRVADIVLRIWNWLDEAKRVPILDMARTRRSQRILAGITISAICVPLLASLIWNVLNGKREYISTDVDIGFARITWLSIIGSWLGIAIILWLGRNIIPIILHGKTALQLFGRASLALVLAFVPILLIYSTAIWILVTFPAIETGLAFEFIAPLWVSVSLPLVSCCYSGLSLPA
jgi:hypothetical protein